LLVSERDPGWIKIRIRRTDSLIKINFGFLDPDPVPSLVKVLRTVIILAR
jgi:hypothetical protein